MSAIDHHAWTNRWRGLHPLEKLAPAAGLLAVGLSLPPLAAAPPVIAVAALAAIAGAGVPARAYFGTVAVALGFLLAGVPVLAVSVEVADGLRVGWAPDGLRLAAEATVRSLAAVACLAFLILTTPVVELVALLRRLGVPRLIRDLMVLTYRMITVFLERAETGRQAQVGRNGYDGFGGSLRSAGLLAATLLDRALDRGRRLEHGLAARGLDGDLPEVAPDRRPSPRRLAAGLLLTLATATAARLLEPFVAVPL